MRTKAEAHRLVMGHTHLVPMIASSYRGARGISFDEIEGAGMVGLVEASKDWDGIRSGFVTFASHAIRNQIRNFIRDWSAPIEESDFPVFGFHIIKPDVGPPGSYEIGKVYEWQSWGAGNIAALAEAWDWADLPNTPEGLTLEWQELKAAHAAIQAAMIGFTKRDREIFHQRFFREPRQSLESIARHHKISYARTVFLIHRMLETIREIVESREAAIPSAMRG